MQHKQQPNAAVYDVLTSEELFRQIVQWSAGWPGIVVCPSPSSTVEHHAGRQFDRSKVAIDVSRMSDVRTLRILSQARWYTHGQLTRFEFTGIDNLIRRGNGEGLYMVLEAMRACGPESASDEYNFQHYYWSLAITHYTGTCDVLDALRLVAPRRFVFDAEWASSAHFILEIQHADVARWFVESFGPSALPDNLIQAAGERGRRALFYYLLSVPSQHVSVDALVISKDRKHLLSLLVQCHRGDASGCANELLARAMKLADVELIGLILPVIASYCATAALAEAALLMDTKPVYNVRWEPPENDGDDPVTLGRPQESKGFRSWLRTRVKKLFHGREKP